MQPQAMGIVLVLGAVLAACGDAGDGVDWVSRDSAGVEIVLSSGEPPVWTIGEEPVLQLGSIDGAGPTQFHRVRDVELLADGGVVVANQGSEELRIFSADGVHRASVGRKGRGPHEFDGLSMIESYGDSLLAWDGGNQRISVWSVDGALGRTFQLEWFDGILFPVDLAGAIAGSDGQPGILAVTARTMAQLSGSGLVVDTALVSVYDMKGALVDSVARLPHNARAVGRFGDLQTTLGAPYTVGASLIGVADGFCYTFGSEPEIRCHDAGGVRRLIRLDLPARAVSDADVERYWRDAFATASEALRSALMRMRDVMPFPDNFPAFAQLLRDDRNRIWARRYRAPQDDAEQWFILDEGRWVGRLDSPIGLRVMDVRGDLLAGVWNDTLGVDYVRVYRLDPIAAVR